MKRVRINTLSKFVAILAVMATMLFGAGAAFAAPNNPQKADNNSQVVAYYPTGIHAIPTDPIQWFEGNDLVMMRGNTGEIQQWFTDPSGHGIHSVWNISNNGSCANGWVLISNAYPNWGDYLTPGADYCVHNNSF